MLSNVKFNNVEVVGKGSVYENKSGKQTMGFAFYYIVNGGKKNRKIVTASSKEECLEKATAFLDKLDKEYEENKKAVSKISVTDNSINVPAPVRVTFKEIGAEWYKEYSSRLNQPLDGLSCSSVENRELCFRTICKHIGDMYVDEISQQTLKDLIKLCSLKEDGTPYSFSHMNKLQQTFHMIMKHAAREGLRKYNFRNLSLKNFQKANSDSKFLDRKQVAEILDILKDNERYSLIVEFLFSSGLRQEELFALTVDDFTIVDDKNVNIHINKSIRRMYNNVHQLVDVLKNENSRRTAQVPYDVYEKTMKYYNDIVSKESAKDKEKRKMYGTEGLIFVNKNKNVLNKKTFERNFHNYMDRQLKKLDKELGYTVTLHMLRHSYASLHAEDHDKDIVASLLGDSSLTVEKNYYSLSNKVKGQVSASSNKLLKEVNNLRKYNNV